MSYDFSFDKKSGPIAVGCLVLAGVLLFFAGFLFGVGRGGATSSASQKQIVKSSEQPMHSGTASGVSGKSFVPLPVLNKKEIKAAANTPPKQEQESKSESTPHKTEEAATQNSNTQAAGRSYCLQFGAFKDENNANKLLADLKKKKVSATVFPLISKYGQTWYAVRTGVYATVEEASRAAAAMIKGENISVLVCRSDAI